MIVSLKVFCCFPNLLPSATAKTREEDELKRLSHHVTSCRSFVSEQTSHSVVSHFWRACRCTNWSSCWIWWAKWKHFSMSHISKAGLSWAAVYSVRMWYLTRRPFVVMSVQAFRYSKPLILIRVTEVNVVSPGDSPRKHDIKAMSSL